MSSTEEAPAPTTEESCGYVADHVREMTAEYIEKKGFVTCEFSVGPVTVARALTEMIEANKALKALDGYHYWHIIPCETCKGYHPESLGHAEIWRDPRGDA